MVLGYVLVCGLGPLTPNSIEGCRIDTRAFITEAVCEELREDVLANLILPAQQYVANSGCILIGTET
jgi:hypothetical protein